MLWAPNFVISPRNSGSIARVIAEHNPNKGESEIKLRMKNTWQRRSLFCPSELDWLDWLDIAVRSWSPFLPVLSY